MNRTDRLLAIVLELQRRRRSYCRAEDLAAHFEVSKRTIYRDVQALCEAGVSIVAADRQGYALVDGYFLPPLHLTTDEALILALGLLSMLIQGVVLAYLFPHIVDVHGSVFDGLTFSLLMGCFLQAAP
jgi:predicted DNA-binding transcriptional regulator YafY